MIAARLISINVLKIGWHPNRQLWRQTVRKGVWIHETVSLDDLFQEALAQFQISEV